MREKKKIVFVCVHNSARSQMAEAVLCRLYGEIYEAYSAGTAPTDVHPLAIEAMAEIGIDISGRRAKGMGDLEDIRFDCAVTVCSSGVSCPFVRNAALTVHKEFDDPAASPDIASFRRVRDEIVAWIKDAFRDPDRLKEMQRTSLPPLEEEQCLKKPR